jgi:hypothetical protein
MPTTTQIPVTNLAAGQQTLTLPATTQPWSAAVITINRSGTGGTHPWFNSLTPTDTLQVAFNYSTDGGVNWHDMGTDTLTGGSHVVKGVTVPVTNEIGVGIGTPFPTGTMFRVILTASTPLTFNGSATYQ